MKNIPYSIYQFIPFSSGIVSFGSIFSYAKNKEKFKKASNNKVFKDAIKSLECDMNNSEAGPSTVVTEIGM